MLISDGNVIGEKEVVKDVESKEIEEEKVPEKDDKTEKVPENLPEKTKDDGSNAAHGDYFGNFAVAAEVREEEKEREMAGKIEDKILDVLEVEEDAAGPVQVQLEGQAEDGADAGGLGGVVVGEPKHFVEETEAQLESDEKFNEEKFDELILLNKVSSS